MESTNRKLQIGVMGSAADLKYAPEIERLAEEIGEEIARAGATLMFGAEKDYDSLSTAACRGAKKLAGLTVGVTYGKGLDDVYEKNNADVIIASAMERGGGRETVLVTSCDGLILISGGSGTLTEAAIAYQANRPVVAMSGTGGWSDKLGGEYLDSRKRIRIETAETPTEAVQKIVRRIRQKALLVANINRIYTAEEAELFQDVIEVQNVTASRELLADGGRMWIFLSPLEVTANKDLDEKEKQFCYSRFDAGETWAGIFRPPLKKRAPIVGFEVAPGYDTHGNYHGGSGSSEGGKH